LDPIADSLESEEEKIEVQAPANRCLGLAQGLRQWLGQELDDQVYWVEVAGERRRVTLASAPVDVGPALQRELYSQVPTVVLTSATLSVGGRSGFQHFQKRLGIQDCTTRLLGSPFDYRRQVELHLFRQMQGPDLEAAACV